MKNMYTTPPSSHETTIQIKQDNKFFSRLLSKEQPSSISSPSFRVYYNESSASVAVPFTWESQPGTPKYTFYNDSIPPLTPPPSYYSRNYKNATAKKASGSSLLHFLFSRLGSLKKLSIEQSRSCNSAFSSDFSKSPSLTSWGSLDSSSSNFHGSLKAKRYHRNYGNFLSCGSSVDSGICGEDCIGSSPTSTLCFGIRGAKSS